MRNRTACVGTRHEPAGPHGEGDGRGCPCAVRRAVVRLQRPRGAVPPARASLACRQLAQGSARMPRLLAPCARCQTPLPLPLLRLLLLLPVRAAAATAAAAADGSGGFPAAVRSPPADAPRPPSLLLPAAMLPPSEGTPGWHPCMGRCCKDEAPFRGTRRKATSLLPATQGPHPI
jgi:hypothetical protein